MVFERGELSAFLSSLGRVRVLTREEEREIADRAVKGDKKAQSLLVVHNLRFAVRVARQYRTYGLPMEDLVQEASCGLVRALERFDPSKGIRFPSYAVWWIRAYIQNYILNSWSLVKIGTTQAQRKLFYKLRKTRMILANKLGGGVTDEQIAAELGEPVEEISNMAVRMRRDFSLDTPYGANDEHGDKFRYLDNVEDADETPEEHCVRVDRIRAVRRALSKLKMTDLERAVLYTRIMGEATMQEIADAFSISRERVNQVEKKLIVQLRRYFSNQGLGELPPLVLVAPRRTVESTAKPTKQPTARPTRIKRASVG